jgi:hypothetical protein
MYPVIGDPPLLPIGIAVKLKLIEVLVTSVNIGGLVGASGKSLAITYISSERRLSPTKFQAETLNL